MIEINASYKGLLTAALMVAVSLIIYTVKGNFDNSYQYVTYALYVAGILWALISLRNRAGAQAGFKQYFAEGFKCFVAISLLMVLFTFIFTKMHPELKDQMAATYRDDLVKKGNNTADEIERMVGNAKQYFTTMLVSMAVFGYLAIGAIVTLLASAFLSMKK